MEKLCIDVRGFSVEKKKRVQDAFFKLGFNWYAYDKDDDKYLNKTQCDNCKAILIDDDGDLVYDTVTHQPSITYPELMRKAGMDESDPDVVEEQAPPKKVGSLTLEVETDLQSIISDYLFLLDAIKDPYARGVIKSQITDLTDLQYNQLKGDNNA